MEWVWGAFAVAILAVIAVVVFIDRD